MSKVIPDKNVPPPKVATFADHEVIMPPNRLRKAVMPASKFDPNPIALAEDALDRISGEFTDWMRMECERLDRARTAAGEAKLAPGSCKELFLAAHDIKGQAETFGYEIAGHVADSLCRLLEHTRDSRRIPMYLIDKHVDAIRAIVRESDEHADATAREVAAALRQIADEFLAADNMDRPDYLETILTPSIAPNDKPA